MWKLWSEYNPPPTPNLYATVTFPRVTTELKIVLTQFVIPLVSLPLTTDHFNIIHFSCLWIILFLFGQSISWYFYTLTKLIIRLNFNKTGNVHVMLHWWAFLQPLLPWKSSKNYIPWVSVSSLSYPACNSHVPYCHLRPAPLYNIFPHYLINGTIFEKTLLNAKCVFWFPLQLLSETFLILRRTERGMTKNVLWSSCKVPIILVRF